MTTPNFRSSSREKFCPLKTIVQSGYVYFRKTGKWPVASCHIVRWALRVRHVGELLKAQVRGKAVLAYSSRAIVQTYCQELRTFSCLRALRGTSNCSNVLKKDVVVRVVVTSGRKLVYTFGKLSPLNFSSIASPRSLECLLPIQMWDIRRVGKWRYYTANIPTTSSS